MGSRGFKAGVFACCCKIATERAEWQWDLLFRVHRIRIGLSCEVPARSGFNGLLAVHCYRGWRCFGGDDEPPNEQYRNR